MSDSISRPWHGAENPLEALHDWMLAELAALEARLSSPPAQVMGVTVADEGVGYTTAPTVTIYKTTSDTYGQSVATVNSSDAAAAVTVAVDQTPPPVPPEQAV